MNDTDHIFLNVVDNENRLTELFRNLLRFRAFRDPVLTALTAGHDPWARDVLDEVEFEDIDTQYRLQTGGRPDLVIRKDDDFEIFVEIKTGDAALTDNQPQGYASDLANSKAPRKLLVFLLPENYAHLKELEHRISDAEMLNIKIEVRFWGQVIDAIENYRLQDLSPVFAEFHKLLLMWFRPPKISFSYEEVTLMFDKKIPEVIEKLCQVVDTVRDQTQKTTIQSNFHKKLPDEYGLYFRDEKSGKEILWFGIWNAFWKEHGKPLTLGVSQKDSPEIVRRAFKKRHADCKEFENYLVASIDDVRLANGDAASLIGKQVIAELEALSGSLAGATLAGTS